MTAQHDRDRAVVAFVIFAIIIILIAISCASNTPTAPVSIVGDGDNPIQLEQDSTQVVNSWVPFVIIIITMFIGFLAYLYFSKRFLGFGRH